MKRKNIERAAKHYSSRDGGVTLQMEIYAFIEGADWRINSVWHDANEEPKYDEFFLYENVVQAFHVDCIFPSQDEAFAWDDYVKDLGLMRWAYIEDLLPTKEDEQ